MKTHFQYEDRCPETHTQFQGGALLLERHARGHHKPVASLAGPASPRPIRMARVARPIQAVLFRSLLRDRRPKMACPAELCRRRCGAFSQLSTPLLRSLAVPAVVPCPDPGASPRGPLLCALLLPARELRPGRLVVRAPPLPPEERVVVLVEKAILLEAGVVVVAFPVATLRPLMAIFIVKRPCRCRRACRPRLLCDLSRQALVSLNQGLEILIIATVS